MKKKFNIFFINLKQRKDRLRFIKKQLKINGLKGSRIIGVDPKNINKKIIQKYKNYLSPSGIAGCLAHKKIWSTIIKKKINYSLILEDDAVLSNKIKPFLKDIINILIKNHKEIDIINLNTHELPTKLGKTIINITKKKIILQEMISTEYGTAGYIISNKCTKKLILDDNFGKLPIDLYLFSKKSRINKKLKILQTSPGLIKPLASFNNKDKKILLNFFDNKKELYQTTMSSSNYNNYMNEKNTIKFTYILINFIKKILKIHSFQCGKIYFYLKHFIAIHLDNKKFKIVINKFKI
jgi:GR25 family glycosyltransferase involved in LPS biosynthesis